jgi:hypothetical protein
LLLTLKSKATPIPTFPLKRGRRQAFIESMSFSISTVNLHIAFEKGGLRGILLLTLIGK